MSFEKATRSKWRFKCEGLGGLLSVEDLWDLSISKLDSVFKILNAKAKREKEETLLDVKSNKDQEVEDMIDIVKHIVRTKQSEAKSKLDEKQEKEKKQRIMSIIAKKKDESLENMSVEELEKLL